MRRAIAGTMRPGKGWLGGGALAALLTLLVGCQITLISAYDPAIDEAATTLQKRMDAFLTKLEIEAGQPGAAYAQHEDFYTDYLVELRSVMVRAQSHPKNTITEQQLTLMSNSLTALRTMHEAGPLDAATLSTTRDLFNQAWRAIITLELAKRRGEA